MKYCSKCGSTVTSKVPPGDNRPRFICDDCATIHYENPRIVAGCVPEYGDSILLCRRSIEPRAGFWTAPAGFMEIGESLGEAAARETLEEACAHVELGPLIAVVDVIRARQVHVFFAARLARPEFAAGEETLETKLYAPDDLPWDEIAFPSVRIALEQTLLNRKSGNTAVHLATAPGTRLS
jgi:ADP-ribose pyrophosphatase YjhB (NUDIX family)